LAHLTAVAMARRKQRGGTGGSRACFKYRATSPRRTRSDTARGNLARTEPPTEPLIPRKVFARLAREIANSAEARAHGKTPVHGQEVTAVVLPEAALVAIQEAAEAYLVSLFENVRVLVGRMNHAPNLHKSFLLARRIRGQCA